MYTVKSTLFTVHCTYKTVCYTPHRFLFHTSQIQFTICYISSRTHTGSLSVQEEGNCVHFTVNTIIESIGHSFLTPYCMCIFQSPVEIVQCVVWCDGADSGQCTDISSYMLHCLELSLGEKPNTKKNPQISTFRWS